VHKNIKNKCEVGKMLGCSSNGSMTGEEDYRPKTEMEREKLERLHFQQR